ncbi:hypothetical protein VNO80_10343 [Phaseolus coccineus]|uniref:Uncharacterized protein n=1 Tax=Phaseolus coccineus TaxID=3886 RepID=A0AAN9NED3_PHACN
MTWSLPRLEIVHSITRGWIFILNAILDGEAVAVVVVFVFKGCFSHSPQDVLYFCKIGIEIGRVLFFSIYIAMDEVPIVVSYFPLYRHAYCVIGLVQKHCLAVTKTRDGKVAENLRIQENAELRKEIERLQFELKHSNNLQQEAEQLRIEKAKDAADRAQEAASLAEEKSKLLAEVDNLKGGTGSQR